MRETSAEHTIRRRLADEMREYLAVSLYLFVCIGAVLLYRGTLLEDRGLDHIHIGAAAIKALVLGKFMMLGRVAGVGEAPSDLPLVPAVLRASVGVLLLLVLLTFAEEFVVGALHHSGPEGALADIKRGRWAEIAAGVLLLWLVLLPYLAFRHAWQALGPEAGRRLLFGDR